MLDIISWILVILLAGLSAYLASSLSKARAMQRSQPREPIELGEGEVGPEPGEQALQGMARYLRTAIRRPLEEGVRKGELGGVTQDAIDALRDLEFFAQSLPEPELNSENLLAVIQEVTREYTLQTGTLIKFKGPDSPVRLALAAERFKDALFLLLDNAGRFGRGQTVEVTVERRDGRVEVRIRDRGPGFSGEALLRAFEPFWSSESDALGLGLPRSRTLLEAQQATVRVGNPDDGGGEAAISFPLER